MEAYEVEVRIKMRVDAPTQEQANVYGRLFIKVATTRLLQEGFSAGDNFNEETRIAYAGMQPYLNVQPI